ncbi:MAG TPA: M3 family metallopeptidase [Candidatus Babeliales bacterium]|nr:M3 family metallopeptidase [Candidatus Babeliales bacterium]
MKKMTLYICVCSITIVFLATLSYCSKTTNVEKKMITKAFNVTDIISLFDLTPTDIPVKTKQYLEEAHNIIDAIIAIPDDQRTFANTAQPLDELLALSNLMIVQRIFEALELLSPDQAIRNSAHDAYISIQAFWVDHVTSNKALYNAFMAYESQNKYEELSAQQRYFISDMVDSFKREGLALDDETLLKVNTLRKELAALTADFDRNIAQDNRTITVNSDELAGLDNDFIATLPQTDNGLYILGVDYPTYFKVMENCAVAQTRKKLYTAFNNRAYPANDTLLKQIIIKRDELAHLLGYTDFASLDIDDQMAHTPAKAHAFIMDLIDKSTPKAHAEIALLTQTLPASVEFSADGKIHPWDWAYLENSYKKTHFNLDEEKIAEYFPMENSIKELLDIYRQFLSIEFQEVAAPGLWHEDVSAVRVVDKNGQLLGTLILDLYPRANKYSHAAHTTIIPASYKHGVRIPDISIVMANFTKPTANKPSLLKRDEVKTFFHEFGHALHAILGATEVASLAGTHTKRDFVELPSQMLEEWLHDKDILKKVSRHYVTGESLPDDMIDTIINLKNLTTGYFVTRQSCLSSLALSYFGSSFAPLSPRLQSAGKASADKDPYTIMEQLYTTMLPYMAFSKDNHFYTSFGHLTGYGAKYYGYLWSKVFALDMFATIKKYGLLNPEIGQRYIKEVLSKGGAQDPNELLYNFLGREPNAEAFLQEMGL